MLVALARISWRLRRDLTTRTLTSAIPRLAPGRTLSCCAPLAAANTPTAMSAAPVHSASGIPWHGPFGSSEIRALNSLTGRKENLVPLHARRLSWYICGPTVYDSAHLGHARAYVTFDLIRRTLSDYFGYDVTYVMNVTDIDDKIILRARKNYLLQQFRQQPNNSFSSVIDAIRLAYTDSLTKLRANHSHTQSLLASATSGRHREELQEKLEQDELKIQNTELEQSKFNTRVSSAEAVVAQTVGATAFPTVDSLIVENAAVLSESLDAAQGSLVTDNTIFSHHSQRYEREFFEDMRALNVRDPSVVTRVTEFIPEIIEFVQKIIDRGMAYETNGSVYFSVAAFTQSKAHYGKLSPASVGNAALVSEGEGSLTAGGEKRNTADFALWKASKVGEPSWQSPWGTGRPGWHIECSCMATKVLGPKLDIHSGGMDLKFPHHDNELAQSEAALGTQQWVNHFWHAGHLNIRGLKMSKSLKNFITIRAMLKNYTARQVRLFFLMAPWDAQISFSEDGLDAAKAKEAEFNEFFLNTAVTVRAKGDWTSESQKLSGEDEAMQYKLEQAKETVYTALGDSFDFPRAIQTLSSLVADSNKYRARSDSKRIVLSSLAAYVDRMMRVFGLRREDEPGFAENGSDKSSEAIIDALCSFRDEIRALSRSLINQPSAAVEILKVCDKFRDDTCIDLGLRIEDSAGTGAGASGQSVWKREDPAKLRQDRQQKLREELKSKLASQDNKINKVKKELTQIREGAVPPRLYFAELTSQYSEFDADGKPTKDAVGGELSKGAKKTVDKVWQVKEKLHREIATKIEREPQYQQRVEQEFAKLEQERIQLQQQLDTMGAEDGGGQHSTS